jgi:general secretion pathway protein D
VAFHEGRKAELRKDYDTALVKFEKALQSEPDNAHFVLHERVARTEASLFHLRQGRRFIKEGRTEDATGEFQKAVSIDPTNEAAAQELTRLLAAQAEAKHAREGALQQALKAREEAVPPSAAQLKPFPPEPIAHFHMSTDSRKIFEFLAKLGGLNVAFSTDFQPRPVSLDLTNVKVEDALRVAALQTKSFWKVVTPNTILLIPDTPTNRRDYEDEVLKTIYLTNPLAAADRTALMTALKQVLLLQRVIENPDSNAIIIRDTPEKVEAAERLIRDLDRGKAEILIEVSVVEADRDRLRDLGLTQVPTSPLKGSNIAGLGFTPRVPAGTTTTIPALTLSRLESISTADFSIVVPGAVANALISDTHTRILQNPQVRVTDGGKAKLRIGSRFPYATGSFLPSFGGSVTGGTGVGGSPNFGLLASTQFQYQDIGVNLDLEPHLLQSGEVALHAKIEISSIGPTVTIGGLDEPSFGQRQIEHDIRLKEGEVSVLGGLIESTRTRSVSGLPGLGQIPGLRYLFSTEHATRNDTEVLVMLTPRVIRLPELASERSANVPLGAERGAPTAEPMLPTTEAVPPTPTPTQPPTPFQLPPRPQPQIQPPAPGPPQ